MNIKNIIFDLGGVIYSIRYLNIADKFKSYGVSNFDKIYSKEFQSDTIDLFEEGKISCDELRDYIRSLSDIPLTDEQIDDAWNAILIDVSDEKIDLLKKVNCHYNVFLLSNTNELNYNCFTQYLNEKCNFNFFDTLFKKAYFSHIMKDRKPHKSVFETIMKEQQLNPVETLFLDDSPQHIEGAHSLGLHTIHIQNDNHILELFDNQGKLI